MCCSLEKGLNKNNHVCFNIHHGNTEVLNLKTTMIIWLEDKAGLLEMKDWEMLIMQPK
jgi:hypothetical protein